MYYVYRGLHEVRGSISLVYYAHTVSPLCALTVYCVSESGWVCMNDFLQRRAGRDGCGRCEQSPKPQTSA